MLRVVLAFALLVASASVATADDFPGGLYAVAGTNPDGTIYEGEAIITNVSEFTCTIEWITADVSSFGICMGRRNKYAASYSLGDAVGLVIYELMADGSMEGVWTVAGQDGVGTETLTPLPFLFP